MSSLRIVRQSKVKLYSKVKLNISQESLGFISSFIGMYLIVWVHQSLNLSQNDVLLIGSFGASSVLIYAAIDSPLAQPRNLIGGHVLSAIVGVSVQQAFGEFEYVAASLAVALSIYVMMKTNTLHPPGGATALIAVLGSSAIKELGFYYVIFPVFSGAMILLFVALVSNNLSIYKKYPHVNSKFTFQQKS